MRVEGVQSDLEAALLYYLRVGGLPAPVTQYKAVEGRRFVWDFAYPDRRLLIEVQGGTWMEKSGHNTGTGLRRDYDKNNHAVLAGWRVLYFSKDMIEDLSAIEVIRKALEEANPLVDRGLNGRNTAGC